MQDLGKYSYSSLSLSIIGVGRPNVVWGNFSLSEVHKLFTNFTWNDIDFDRQLKGGAVAVWFKALDLKSGGPRFKSSFLQQSGFSSR